MLVVNRFVGGETNACYNAVDRHIAKGNGDRLALIHDSPVTSTKRYISYAELHEKVYYYYTAVWPPNVNLCSYLIKLYSHQIHFQGCSNLFRLIFKNRAWMKIPQCCFLFFIIRAYSYSWLNRLTIELKNIIDVYIHIHLVVFVANVASLKLSCWIKLIIDDYGAVST